MPIKQVVCAQCGLTVNKAQTYHIGSGKRACKTHEGVQGKKDQLEENRKEKIQRSVEWFSEKKAKMANPPLSPTDFGPNCWLCGVNGLRQDEFFARVLVDREKARKLYGYVNPLDLSHLANQPPSEPCIFVLPKEKCANVVKYLPWQLRDLPEMSGVMAICGPCVYKNKIDALPEVNPEQLAIFTVTYELFLKPLVQKAASQELTRDN